ncbi:MAG: alpha-keto acid decarboxylase family protein, partial [Acidobacteriaceae bacterium]|nr:alpha-keto acid decarboxylase family protein [Acidobacteriaceae bacterium]
MTIGDYLLCRLSELGVRHIFGVPGDYNLQFLDQVIRFEKRSAPGQLLWIGTCNELNAAYAADGYARLAGMSALVVTHGVGSLSALNGIAGAHCERVPVVCISGSPSLSVLDRRLLVHHTVGSGNYNDVLDCYRYFTVAQARLTPANAAGEIDRVLAACWREKRPVYLELPSDISCLEIASPASALSLAEVSSDPERLSALAEAIAYRFNKAERPALLLDTSVERFKLQPEILTLAERAQAPFAVLSSAKGVITENSPLFLGTYVGSWSRPLVRERVEQSDCLLSIGARLVDANTGLFTHFFPDAALIDLQPFSCSIGRDDYQGIDARQVLRETSKRLTGSRKLFAPAPSPAGSPVAENALETKLRTRINQEIFW